MRSDTDDVRIENVPDPAIGDPTNAMLRVTSARIRGSALWPSRGIARVQGLAPRGHEYVGIVGQVNTGAKEMHVCVE